MKLVFTILTVLLVSGCSVVGPGERGVRVSLGTVSSEPKQPGAYVWFPFILGMKKIDIQLQKSEVESSAASKDMQEIKAHVAVNWSLSPKEVVTTYQNIGDESDILERIIKPAVNEVMKASAAKRTAEEVLTKRMEMKKDIDDGLKDRLAKHGITLDEVSIVNLSFSSEFSKAIERKQIAEQEAKQAEYDTKKAVQRAKSEVETAKGEAEANLTKTTAQAKGQKLLKETLTPQMIQLEYLKKWDGTLPQVMSGNGSGMILNLPNKNEKGDK